MFNLKFAKTYDFAIMTKNNLDHVLEDYYIAEADAFCVADGITRDFKDGTTMSSYPTTKEEALKVIEKYPNPSGAAKAAKVCAETFISSLYSFNDSIITEKEIFSAVKNSNSQIQKLNADRKIDYLANDYFATVAVGGKITKDTLYCFAIGDCEILVLDEEYNPIFRSAKTSEEKALAPYKEPFFLKKIYKSNWNWSNPAYRVHIRKNIRNNTLRKFLKKHSFGALTGEKKALPFINSFAVPLENAKYILAYSDGVTDCISSKENLISIIKDPEQIKNENHEKTLVIYEKE